jgi:hypothetical protein
LPFLDQIRRHLVKTAGVAIEDDTFLYGTRYPRRGFILAAISFGGERICRLFPNFLFRNADCARQNSPATLRLAKGWHKSEKSCGKKVAFLWPREYFSGITWCK